MSEVYRRERPGYQRAEIPMAAFGKARPRSSAKVRGRKQHIYMPPEYMVARAELSEKFGAVTVAAPWIVRVTAVRQMPFSWSKRKRAAMDGAWCTTKPDADNVLGAVMDALFGEDAAVVSAGAEKQWGQAHLLVIEILAAGERPGE